MSDESVREALRSDGPLVVIEAPAGCGKTYQGAEYAQEIAPTMTGRMLILTHTHAACSVFAERTLHSRSRIEIRTVDSLLTQIAAAYHVGLSLPPDVPTWAREEKNGYAHVALKAVALLKRHPAICASVAKRYPIIVCDEHQDCSGDQHALTTLLLDKGSRVRVFADPMQGIYKDKPLKGASPSFDWSTLKQSAHAYEELDTPHRWGDGCKDLGRWTLKAREALKNGQPVDLRTSVPRSVSVIVAENQAQGRFDYLLSGRDRGPIDTFERQNASLLILTHYNETARSLRGFFNRRVPLWEGYTRNALERLTHSLRTRTGDAAAIAAAVVEFMGSIGKGFSPSAFGDRLEKEVAEGCRTRTRGKPALIQELASFLIAEPDHRGVSKALARMHALRSEQSDFRDIEIDCHREFWEAVRLGDYGEPNDALADLHHKRTYMRPKPPDKAISTIHKAKGLECGAVVVMPCDATTFPDRPDVRALLYVALSRAKHRLMLVVSRNNPSPLLQF